jgi:tetratricopeptide (TPR) repeat protein
MELSPKQWLEQAKALEKRGETEPAALAYTRAGAHEDAVRVSLSAGNFVEAGQALLRSIEYDRRKRFALDANQRKVALKAAICFSRGGDVRPAVELFLAAGERSRAVGLLQEAGDFVNAARVEADPTGQVELVGYESKESVAPEAAASADAAHNLERAGKLDAALEAYSRLKQWSNAAALARRLGHVEQAASLFSEAGEPFQAAVCFREMRDADQELQHLVKVAPADAHYREACVRAIAMACDRALLSFELEQLVGKFVDAGPASDDEVDACYRLAQLFDTHEAPENAALCYRKILGVRPGYRDVADRLRAAETDFRGAAAKDYERVFKEELALREAAKRHEAPPAAASTANDKESLGELPVLPELPDLPELPEAAAPLGSQAGRHGSAPTPALHTRMLSSPDGRPPSAVAGPSAPAAAPAAVEPGSTWGVATQFGFQGVALEEGALVNRRYRLEKKIGQGGIGAVWKAVDLELDETIAIKFLGAQFVDEETLGRFKQEVSLSRHFNHPNIIRMYDIGTCADQKYITMELLSGHDLGEIMRRGPLALDQGLALLVQACHALQVVHDRGVIHRDIKPDNFFITDDGVLKVMDFGIAKRHSASRGLTRAGMMAGTPQYMAPEQASNFGGVTHLADLYALGCIAYQMFTGAVPFDADEVMPILMAHMSRPPEPPRQRNPAISTELEAVILRLLAKKPEDRVQSCRELAEILLRLRPTGDAG